jgi:hypothetical protein
VQSYQRYEGEDSLKRDLAERDKLIEQKNKEIIRLRLLNDELNNGFTG